jgi:hypothetical protein
MKKVKRRKKIGAIGAQISNAAIQIVEFAFGFIATEKVLDLVDEATTTADIKGIGKIIPAVVTAGMLYVSATAKNADVKVMASASAARAGLRTIGKLIPNNKLGIKAVPQLKPNAEIVPIVVDEPNMDFSETNISGYGSAIAGYANAIAGAENDIYV